MEMERRKKQRKSSRGSPYLLRPIQPGRGSECSDTRPLRHPEGDPGSGVTMQLGLRSVRDPLTGCPRQFRTAGGDCGARKPQ